MGCPHRRGTDSRRLGHRRSRPHRRARPPGGERRHGGRRAWRRRADAGPRQRAHASRALVPARSGHALVVIYRMGAPDSPGAPAADAAAAARSGGHGGRRRRDRRVGALRHGGGRRDYEHAGDVRQAGGEPAGRRRVLGADWLQDRWRLRRDGGARGRRARGVAGDRCDSRIAGGTCAVFRGAALFSGDQESPRTDAVCAVQRASR